MVVVTTTSLWAQITITVTPTQPSCSANGEILVEVNGGSGNYTYFLEGDCGEDLPIQMTGLFTTLQPCTYTVTVTDDVSGSTATESLDLISTTEPLSAALSFINCELVALAEGGAQPYTFTYSETSETGPFIDLGNDSIIPVGQVMVWVRITDDCGNTVLVSGDAELTAITDFLDIQEENGLHISPIGGSAPYTFTLMSSAGTFMNDTGIFPWDQVGCTARITITSPCNGSTLSNQLVDFNINITVECIRFFDGYAAFSAFQPGREPYTFFVETPSGNFTSTDGIFTDLPPNVAYYRYYVEDACGLRSTTRESTRYQLSIQDNPYDCTNDSLSFQVIRQCSGPFFAPAEVACLSCPNQQVESLDYSFQNVLFTGNTPGNWEIMVVDDCGDQLHCADSVILELIPACDSIIVTVVDQFECDNGINNRRVINDTTAIFTLFDASGNVVAIDSLNGVFENLPLGQYRVEAQTACGFLEAETTLSNPVDIQPITEFFVYYNDYEFGYCQLNYSMKIEKRLGPFVVTGGPEGTYYEVLNNHNQDNCRWYYLEDLLPGDYTITSMPRCGTMEFNLPEVGFSTIDSVSVLRHCPEDRRVEVHGIRRSTTQWRAIFQDLGIMVENENLRDRYYVNGQYYSTNTIIGLPPGEHTVYLVPRFANLNCPVDSFTFTIPDYEAVELFVDGNIICDGAATSDLSLRLTKGKGPYVIRQIDCNSPTQVITSYQAAADSTLVIPDMPAGIYCFVVEDDCHITNDFQVEIRPYTDDIEVDYTCEPSLQLQLDTLNAGFAWYNVQGDIIGQSNEISIAPPTEDASYTVFVALTSCTLERTLDVPYRPVIPEISSTLSEGDTLIQCGEEELTLTAQADEYSSLLWSTGWTADTLRSQEAGLYWLEATNDLGCETLINFYIQHIPLPQPDILGPADICEGDSTYLVLSEAGLFASVSWSGGLTFEDSLLVNTDGDYNVVVEDSYGCQGIDSFNLVVWPLPEPIFSNDSLVCPNDSTSLVLAESYEAYIWDTNENTPSIRVGAGTYEVSVIDGNGCTKAESITIVEHPQVYANLTGDTTICFGDTAFLQLELSRVNALASGLVIGEGGLSITFSDYAAGDFIALVPESSSAMALAEIELVDYPCPVLVEGGAVINVNQIEVSTSIQPISCYGETDGAVIVNASSQFSPFIYQWADGATSFERTELASGDYLLTITDALQCSRVELLSVPGIEPLNWEIDALSPNCYGDQNGLIQVNQANGGTAPYTIYFQGIKQNANLPLLFSELLADHHELLLEDAHGCMVDSVIYLQEPLELQLNLGEDKELILGETLILRPQINFSDVASFIWQGLDSVARMDSLVWHALPFESTNVALLMEDAKGCIVSDTISLRVDRDVPVFVPNAFSPNGDGINDTFTLYSDKDQNLTIVELQVFDRWGNQVFDGENLMMNDNTSGWDATYRGRPSPTGVYTWMARISLADQTQLVLEGDVTIIK